MIQLKLPPEFVAKVQRMFGDQGRQWLPQLPQLLAQCRDKWELREPAMCSTMSMNYIEFALTQGGDHVAVKIGVPHDDLFTEMVALGLYDGCGAVRLIDADRELGAILMQRAVPGTMLWQQGDNRTQTSAAAAVMGALPVLAPGSHGLPRVADQVARAFAATREELDPQERMPRDLLTAAESALELIQREGGPEQVLHGDLHHENIILDHALGWLAIDPKGVIGARCMEVGRYLQNQIPDDLPPGDRTELLEERLAIFSVELEIDRRLLICAALVDFALGHCWGLEEETLSPGWFADLETGRVLRDML
jgi:streptomycin 6-kinase